MTLFFETQKNSLAIPEPKMNCKSEVRIFSLEEEACIKGFGDLETW